MATNNMATIKGVLALIKHKLTKSINGIKVIVIALSVRLSAFESGIDGNLNVLRAFGILLWVHLYFQYAIVFPLFLLIVCSLFSSASDRLLWGPQLVCCCGFFL